MPCDHAISEDDIDLALGVLHAPDSTQVADALYAVAATKRKAAEVISKYLDAVLAPPPNRGVDVAGDPTEEEVHRAFSAGVTVGPDLLAPAGVVPLAGDPDDGRWFFGKNLQAVRKARAALEAELVRGGKSRAEAASIAAGISPAAILALLLQYGPDIVRIVRELIDRLRTA